jgi:hypothetical protein
MTEDLSEIPEIKSGADFETTAEYNEFALFRLQVTDTTKMLVIRADPANELSDPDLYISNEGLVS